MAKTKAQTASTDENELNSPNNLVQNFIIRVLRIWSYVTRPVRRCARVILWTINSFMLPHKKTGRPNIFALVIWLGLNVGLAFYSFLHLSDLALFSLSFLLGTLHFLIIWTAFLVIGEELDVWNGYIRAGINNEPDERTFPRGKAVKSVPLICVSVTLYVVFIAIALHTVHANFNIFGEDNLAALPPWQYLLTVASQIPFLRSAVGKIEFLGLPELTGWTGLTILVVINAANTSVLIATITSYVRQKSEIRKLLDTIQSGSGDKDLLNKRASHAPDEIKLGLIHLALNAKEAPVRHRAMSVARYKSILTFPKTIIYHLHEETDEDNKTHAVDISRHIINANLKLDHKLLGETLGKVEYQLDRRRQKHSQEILTSLVGLRTILNQRIQSLASS